MPPSLVSPYTTRVGTQILLTDLHYDSGRGFFVRSGYGRGLSLSLRDKVRMRGIAPR